jgi:hypothetical protein
MRDDLELAELRRRTLTRAIAAVFAASGMSPSSGNNDQTNKGLNKMSIDPFREMAAALHSRQGFDGTMTRFSKEGHWYAGKDKESLDSCQMLALVNDMMRGLVLWQDKRPADYHVGLVRDRYMPPRREQLGHTDKSRWRRPNEESWSRKFGQRDRWSFRLMAGTLCPSNQERL